jgi:hypothetical protein
MELAKLTTTALVVVVLILLGMHWLMHDLLHMPGVL